ncbi:MAG: nuclear transport factor 2 family protein [Chakrabartia sp.]
MFRTAAIATALAAAPVFAADTPIKSDIPEGTALTAAIQTADTDLFTLFFQGCDPEKLRAMVSDTLEFYHDKAGLTGTTGAAFVSDYAKNCEARKTPDTWRSRRALVPESLHVDPVPGFGAMEVGEHIFYERQGDGAEKLVGRAGFAMVWKHEEGQWKLHRVLSFGHKPVK